MTFYDPDGNTISPEESVRQVKSHPSSKTRFETNVGEVRVASEFLFGDANPRRREPDSVPWLWETTIYGGQLDGVTINTSSRVEAQCVHDAIVMIIKDNVSVFMELGAVGTQRVLTASLERVRQGQSFLDVLDS